MMTSQKYDVQVESTDLPFKGFWCSELTVKITQGNGHEHLEVWEADRFLYAMHISNKEIAIWNEMAGETPQATKKFNHDGAKCDYVGVLVEDKD